MTKADEMASPTTVETKKILTQKRQTTLEFKNYIVTWIGIQMLFKKLVVPVKVKQFSGIRRKYTSDIGRRGWGMGGGSCDHMLPSFPPSTTTFH